MVAGQLVFDGLATGLVFVMLAAGMVLIISVSKILFMAYGMFYTIGAYTTWYIMEIAGIPYVAALVAAVVTSAVLGAVVYLLVFRRLQKIPGAFMSTLIASIGLMMVLNQANLLIFGTSPRSIPSIFRGNVMILGVGMPVGKLALIVIGVVICVVLFLIYEKTALGRAMRAVSFLPETAALQGINATRIYMVAIGAGTALAGIAGGLIAPTYGMNTSMGSNVIWTVMLMCMLGGMDSLLGAVVGGLIIGQILSFGQYYIGSPVQIVLFLIIGVVLYFRPNGLLGRGIGIET
jgi:branched-chain amino acid transport system permease protein